MVIENAVELKKSLQRLPSAKEAGGRRISAEVLQKMQTKREKQKSSTPTGDPLQRVGSELKKRKSSKTISVT